MTTPVYMFAQIDVKDYESYAEQYGLPVAQMFAEVGAKILVATPQVELLEGTWSGNWTVLVEIPSAEVARQLYDSERYAPFKRARIDRLTDGGTLAILPGLGPA